MCGIVAIFSYHADAPPVDSVELMQIREAMLSRGPDGAGLWVSRDQKVGLAHRRLAIIDTTDAGAQPMATPDGRLRITFNGEIYNYRELRASLSSRGYVFLSNSDTEVLLYLYREHGKEMLPLLRGMYALAIWDEERRALFLARDPLGIKPLYYADDGKTIRVASQVKALVAGGAVDIAAEPAGHVGFFLWGYVPEPYTLYKGIRALPAGSTLWVTRGSRPTEESVYSVTRLFEEAESRAENDHRNLIAGHSLREHVIDSVRHHLVADVPVGVFLSAGIDSSTLAALVTETGGDLRTITLGFREYLGTSEDETQLAEQMAHRYGARHQTAWITKKDFQDALPRVLAAMDQPSIDGVNTYFVARAAASIDLKVAISGLGGDELFAGYSHFEAIPRLVGALAWADHVPWAGRTFRIVSAPILKRLTSPKYAGLLEYGGTLEGAYLLRRGLFMPWELPEVLDGEMVREGWRALEPLARLEGTHDAIRSERLKITALDFIWYLRNQLLRDADWASMAHSVEVRTPLVDWKLLNDLTPVLVRARAPGKADLGRLPEKSLPEAVRSRAKTGFSVPVREWMLAATGLRDRGLRGWARFLHRNLGNHKRALMLLSDAYGGHGGIAKFNRDFLRAATSHPGYREIIAVPRLQPGSVGKRLPSKLRWDTGGLGGKIRYGLHFVRGLARDRRYELVVCGLINMLPLALVARAATHAPLLLIIHGIEAWRPRRSVFVNRLVRKVDYVIAVSETTKERFVAWSGFSAEQVVVIPNCVDSHRFHPMPKNPKLVKRYGLDGRKVLMTLARLDSRERYKGVDQILEIMPMLVEKAPDLVYLVVGDGDDRDRLAQKAKALDPDEHVIFAGHVPEEEKVDHYNIADAFAMPGWGEGFGIAYLEAMACGVPVVGSILDGSKDALRGGKLGVLVDPRDANDVRRGILEALSTPRGVPAGLEYFSYPRNEGRLKDILDHIALYAHTLETQHF